MVDATAMGTTVVKVRSKMDLEMIVERMEDGEGLDLVRDLTFDYEFLEEGRSLVLVEKTGVYTKAEMYAAIAAECEEKADGKFDPPLTFAFFIKSCAESAVAGLAEEIAKGDKKRKEQAFTDDAYAEAGIGKDEKFQYNVERRKWDTPESISAADTRQGDTRYVQGGPPKALGSGGQVDTGGGATLIKKITKYMTGDRDEQRKLQKVYITDEDVVNCEQSRIKVDFKQTSYSVKVNSDSATYVLGPIQCGHILPSECSWKLSKGKRLTINLNGSKPEEHPAVKRQAEEAESALAQGGDWQMMFGVIAMVVVAAIVMLAIGGKS